MLNLPNTASQGEIRERYRTLSVIFHPDKQHDERTKDTAASKFLDVQKAYEGEIPDAPRPRGRRSILMSSPRVS